MVRRDGVGGGDVWRASAIATQPVTTLVVLAVGSAVAGVFRLVWRHPVAVAVVLGPVVVASVVGWPVLAGTVGLVAVALLVWRTADRVSFTRRVEGPARDWWLLRVVYARRWPVVMHGCGLAAGRDHRGRLVVPVLERVRELAWSDRLLVRLLAGQEPADLADASSRIAHGLASRGCRVWPADPGRVWVELPRGTDRLAAPFALSVPDRVAVRLDGVPVGLREDGELWRLPVLGAHVLVGGSTGAGKGSVLWSLLRGLAPAVADGTVRVWAVDPKGGMELGGGLRLFARFATSTLAAVELLDAAVRLMQDRAGRLAGLSRLHTPTPAEPLVLVVVDELAALVAYEPDASLRAQIVGALQLLLSQGRAVGVSVVAAVQDPRKDKVPFRDLFSHRVALRLDEPAQADLVLGDGARKRGAACDEIPHAAPGVGFTRVDGNPQPVRVRAGWVTDTDISELCRLYPAPAPIPDGGTHGDPIF